MTKILQAERNVPNCNDKLRSVFFIKQKQTWFLRDFLENKSVICYYLIHFHAPKINDAIRYGKPVPTEILLKIQGLQRADIEFPPATL